MAVGMLLAGEGVTKDAYAALTEKMFGNYPMREDQAPEGLIVHTAGETAEGWYIYDIWESREAFQRFNDGQLGAAVRQVFGDQPPPPGSEPQYYEIESLIAPS